VGAAAPSPRLDGPAAQAPGCRARPGYQPGILDSWQRFQAERSLAQRVAGAVTDDPDTIGLYFGYARAGRAALWIHVPDEADAKRAIRGLADHPVLRFRHYGHDSQQDLHIR
jgi:hypothetical protein